MRHPIIDKMNNIFRNDLFLKVISNPIPLKAPIKNNTDKAKYGITSLSFKINGNILKVEIFRNHKTSIGKSSINNRAGNAANKIDFS